MTANQLKLREIKELERANRAREKETRRQNREARRHNEATETISTTTVSEQRRANIAREHENFRANVAKEAETQRHNYVVERSGLRQLEEQARHNLATEDATAQNLQYLYSKAQKDYSLGQSQIGLGYANLGETQRHNERTEYNTSFQNTTQRLAQQEVIRHNIAEETTLPSVIDLNIARTKLSGAQSINQLTGSATNLTAAFRNYTSGIKDSVGTVTQLLPFIG